MQSDAHRAAQDELVEHFARRCFRAEAENAKLRRELRRLRFHSLALVRLLDARSSQVDRLVTSVCEMIALYRSMRAAVAGLHESDTPRSPMSMADIDGDAAESNSFSGRSTASLVDVEENTSSTGSSLDADST